MDKLKEVPFAVTICDREGKILEMNDRSKQTFASHGDIIGHSLFDCHHGPAEEKLRGLLQNHNINAYTISKNGQRKLIYQTPWYENGQFAGYVELSLVLPDEMPHYIRS